MSLLKKIGKWCVIVFFALATLAYFPSFASLCAVLIFALMLPIAKWKAFYGKYIFGKWKTILIIALVVLFFCTAPTTTEETLPDTTIPTITEPSTEATTEPTAEPTIETIVTIATEATIPSTEATTEPSTEATTVATTAPTNPPSTEPPATTSTTPPETQPAHTHKFSPATCVSPQTCSCGATEGNPNGHAWISATCTTPKTCSSCGETSGTASAHSYSSGTCSDCGTKDPNYSAITYVLNTKSKKFHSPYCRKLPTDNRSDTTMSREEVIAAGYDPCGICNP